MDKETLDIRSYLPGYYKGFREIDILAEVLFYLLSQLSGEYQQILGNQFVQSADAIGVGRFEKILGIATNTADDLETRRQRILSKMAVSSVFTYRVLENTLKEMCDNEEYKISSNLDNFTMDLKVRIGRKGMLDVLYDLLYMMLPAHISFNMHNHLPASSVGGTTYALATRIKKTYGVVDAVNEKRTTKLPLLPGAATRISSKKEVVDAISKTLSSMLGLYPSGAVGVSTNKDITDAQEQKLSTEQKLDPVAAVAIARVIKN